MKKITGLITIIIACFIGMLFLIGVQYVSSKKINEDTYIFNVKQTAITTNEKIIEFLNQEESPIHLDFEFGKNTYVYGNKAYFNKYEVDYPSTDQFYQNGNNGEGDLGNSLTLDLSNKYKYESIENVFEYQDSEYLYVLAEVTNYSQLKELESDFESVGFIDIALSQYDEVKSLSKYVLVLLTLCILLIMIQLFIFENEHLYDGKRHAVLKLNGFNDMDLYKEYILKKKNVILSSLLISTVLFFILNLNFKFTIQNNLVLLGYLLLVAIVLVGIYLISVLMLKKKLKAQNVITILKNEKDTGNQTLIANILNGVMRILIMGIIIGLIYVMPMLSSKIALADDWKQVEDDVSTNTFAYANLKTEEEIELLMQDEEDYFQILNEGMNYFEENYNGWFVFPNSYYTDDYDNSDNLEESFFNRLVFANYNYLGRIKFPNLEQLSRNKSYLLLPECSQEIENEVENYFNQLMEEDEIYLDYDIVYYPTEFEFYSYDTKGLEETNGYYQRPFVYISSEQDKGPVYTQYIYQNFYYKAESIVETPLKEVEEYHGTSDLYSNTKTDSKYAEYSYVMSMIKFVLLILSAVLISCIVMYIVTTNVLIYCELKKNQYKNVIQRINGYSLFEVYTKLYKYYIVINLLALVIGTILILVLKLNIILWILLVVVYLIFEFSFLTYQVNKIENKYILKTLKEK